MSEEQKKQNTPEDESLSEALEAEEQAPGSEADQEADSVSEEVEAGAEASSDESSDEQKEELTDEQKITLLANDLAKAKEDVLRAQAEAQNARRRSEGDVEKARKFALERFVGDLLPVVDNLDRALDAIDQDDETFKSVVEGIELTRKSFLDTLAKNHVVQIDPAGEPFDPEIHQAMTMVPNPDLEPNTVMDVFQKGYSLNGRLIRPAMVVVSKAAD